MSRFDRRHFDYEYGADPWAARIFSGPEDDKDDDDDDEDDYPRRSSARRRAPASVVSYGGDLDSLRQHQRRKHEPSRHRQSSSRPSKSSSNRPRPKPSLSPSLSALTDRELEKESLKQRLSLERNQTSYQRARSLSLSRVNNWTVPGHGFSSDEEVAPHRWEIPTTLVPPPPPAPVPPVGYYQHEPVALSNSRIILAEVPASRSPPLLRPRESRERPRDRDRDRDRDRYERGYQVVDLDLEPRHGHVQGDDLRFRLGPVDSAAATRLPNPRVPSGKRSASYERWEHDVSNGRKSSGRKAVSPGTEKAGRATL